MRQSGVLAATCLYALDHHIGQQSLDNELAASIETRIKPFKHVTAVLPAETNIVIFDVSEYAPTAIEIVEILKRRGVLVGAFGERRVRVVTCLNVDDKAADILVEELSSILDVDNVSMTVSGGG